MPGTTSTIDAYNGTLRGAGAADAVTDLGALVLDFGRIKRITYHQDGERLETDTTHTVMLGLIACSLVDLWREPLDLGKVAQYAMVHDFVEVFAGDTPTLVALSDDQRRAKQEREHQALLELERRFGQRLPWLVRTIADYERQDSPEARYVRALDKIMPKITHVLNGAVLPREQGMSAHDLEERYELQLDEIRAYAGEFGDLLDLREEMVDRVLAILRQD